MHANNVKKIVMKKYFVAPAVAGSLVLGGFTAVNNGAEVRLVDDGYASYVLLTRAPTLAGKKQFNNVVIVDKVVATSAYASFVRSVADILRPA